MLVGGPITRQRVVITDDFITAGTAVAESVRFIKENGGTPVGVITLFDRQEKGIDTDISAIQEILQKYGFRIFSILRFSHLLDFAQGGGLSGEVATALAQYRKEWGVEA